jgi:hypothetical protein
MSLPSATIVYATKPGGTTRDRDELGGNPFATALIELAPCEHLTIENFLQRLRNLTIEGSSYTSNRH